MLRFLTAGESHGPALVTIVEGLPAGLAVSSDAVNHDLARRQAGYGRGGRQSIEHDQVELLAGVPAGETIGAPVALLIRNRDWANWRERTVPPWTRPRPGHADLAAGTKYHLSDLRMAAERASARETAARVAAGSLAKLLLAAVGARVAGYVVAIGDVCASLDDLSYENRMALSQQSDVACPDSAAAQRMRAAIDAACKAGDSLGGIIEVVALGLPVGLGSHVHWDRRLDGRLAQAVMSIQAIKGIEIGPAFDNAALPGTQVHDALYLEEGRVVRRTNRAGGLEGGITNGEAVVVRAAMKPIPTTVTPQQTVDLATQQPAKTEYQRSDVCAVPAAAVVAEAMVAWVLADALLERYGGDTLGQIVARVQDDVAS